MLKKIVVCILLLQLVSCAKKYHPLSLQTMGYPGGTNVSGIEVGYLYNVLSLKGNRRYAKKERRKDIRLVAVKITNHFDHSINVRRDIQFMANGNPVELIEPQIVYNKLKQRAALYVLYAFAFFRVPVNNSNGTQSKIVVPIGLPFAAYNMAVGFGANKKFLMDLEMFNLNSKIVMPGESAIGLISVYNPGYPTLSARLK